MCTNFFLSVTGKEKGFINGRSMEFADDLKSRLFFRAAGHHFSALNFGDYQYEWTGRHNVIGMNSHGLPVLTDGMNDVGLATGDLWLPGSEYQKITNKKLGLSIDRFIMWLLSSFAKVGEVKEAIERGDVQVGAPVFVQNLLPLHFPVHDADGHSIVIEFTGGKPMIYDNPVGTLTNQPVFPWQLENLRNYVDVTPWDCPAMTINGLKLEPTGHGSGMMHLPGDPTPPSRFVKATMLTHFADPVDTLDEGINLAFHILNTVDIPEGINKYKNKLGGTDSDYTQWVVVKDLTRKTYSVRLYDSPLAYSVNLLDLDWKALDGKQVDVPASPVTLNLNQGGPDNRLAARAIDTEPLRVLPPSSGTGR